MSVINLRSLNQLCRILKRSTKVKYAQEFCLRCSSTSEHDRSLIPKPKMSEKEQKISKAMQAYLDRKKEKDNIMEGHIQEYELGKRHLANIMGKDPDDFTQKDIDEALSYLLPSGLYSKEARPLLKHPLEIFPKMFAVKFDATGRPNHFLFYTIKQNYYELMHDIAWKIEDLKAEEDEAKTKSVFDFQYYENEKLDLIGSAWIPQRELENILHETITEPEYNRFVVIMEHLCSLPMSYRVKEFIMNYRYKQKTVSDVAEIPKPIIDENGRRYMTGSGKRKSSVAEVKVYGQGTGEISINGTDITYFTDLLHRAQVIQPLKFTGTLGKVDIVADVTSGGPTGQSGAIRVAVARALRSFVDIDMVEKMRIAGLLTTDPRKRERKKPGQEGARRKYTWKKR